MRKTRKTHQAHWLPKIGLWRLVKNTIQATALVVGLVALSYSPVLAATQTVTTTNDSGAGSLRDAIANAASGDSIVFAPSLSGQTIALSSRIEITLNLTITGGQVITLSGNDTTPIFDIDNGATVTLDGLTFVNGYNATLHGGAIVNSGNLTVTNSLFSDNEAGQNGGALFSDGTVTISDSSFINNVAGLRGGAIDNNGTMALTNGQISNNRAINGGGLGNSGTFTVETTQILNNTALNGAGGGIANSEGFTVTESTLSGNSASNGGGLYNSGEMTVERSTLAGNQAADGAGASNSGGLHLNNSTFSANIATNLGGALFNSVSVNLRNSTLTENEAPSGAGIYSNSNATYPTHTLIVNQASGDDCVGVVTSNSYNIDSDGSCSLEGTGDQPSQTLELGELADNGGPTQTHSIPSGSSAHNGGNTTCQASDQRGIERAQNTNCDIGAHELIVPTMTILGNSVPLTNGDDTPDVADDTNYGNVPIDEPKTTIFSITNSGEEDLVITDFDTTDPRFAAIGLPLVIPGNSTVELPIQFSPGETEEFTATLTITHNDPAQEPFVFTVMGTGVPAVDDPGTDDGSDDGSGSGDGSGTGDGSGSDDGSGVGIGAGSGGSAGFSAVPSESGGLGTYRTDPNSGCWQSDFLIGCVFFNSQRIDYATGGNHYLDVAEIVVQDNLVCLNVPAGYQISGYTLNQDPDRFVANTNCYQYDPITDFDVYRVDFAIIPVTGASGPNGDGSGTFASGSSDSGSGSAAERGAFFAQGATVSGAATPTETAVPPTQQPTEVPAEVISVTSTAYAVAVIQATEEAVAIAQATEEANPTRIAERLQQEQQELSIAATTRAEALVIQTPTYLEQEAAEIARTRRYFIQDVTLYILIGGSVIALGLLGGMAAQSMVHNRQEEEE